MNNLAVAICRVSTPEQRLSNSLNRQEESVKNSASELGVEIVKTWSGDASSKVGSNLKRKDLKEAIEFCRANRRVKYLIVDEVDRFMRSTAEMFYWIIRFQQEANVKVHFACNPELNTDDAKARLLLSLDSFKAEGSNEERQSKSVSGHEKAIREGRWTFPVKPGYVKGPEAGMPLPHPITFIPLQRAYKDVLSRIYTPREALVRLNESSFSQVYAKWDMDKFRKYSTDGFYCGELKPSGKQVKAYNPKGLHKPMLTREEFEKLGLIFNNKYKPRGKSKQYNPEFPLNKLLLCSDCEGKYTGAEKNNGVFRDNGKPRKTIKYYQKYTCRGCGKSYHRHDIHPAVYNHLDKIQYTGKQRKELIEALSIVWSKKRQDRLAELNNYSKQIERLDNTKSKLIIEMTNADESIKQDIVQEVEKVKHQIIEYKEKISNNDLNGEFIEFIKFSLEYSNKLAEDWWKLNREERERCQQLFFPSGIFYGSNKKVSTPEISFIYSLEPNKKDLSFSEKSLMVELARFCPSRPLVNSLDDYKLVLFERLKL